MRPTLVALALVLLAGGCSTSGPETGFDGTPARATVEMHDGFIGIEPGAVRAGKTTFELRNRGEQEHELLVFLSERAAGELPVEEGRIEESVDGMKLVAAARDIEPGETRDFELTLGSGRYVFACNKTGHYEEGMRSELQVVTDASQAVGRRQPDLSREHDGEHVLVKFRPWAKRAQRRHIHDEVGARPVADLAAESVRVVRVRDGDVAGAVQRYRRRAAVEFAEPNFEVTALATPNDPYYPGNANVPNSLWGLHNSGQNNGLPDADIDAPEGWDTLGLPSTGQWPVGTPTVGVVDTGVQVSHEDLIGKVITPCFTALDGTGALTQGCLDDNNHGTHVAGTIAAYANNGRGIAGVAPTARIYACKALDSAGSGWMSDVVACINEFVAKRDHYNLRVINMSLGGGASATLEAAVKAAIDNGVLVVAAAGNDGSNVVRYPAGYADAVSVAAVDRNGDRASFSNANAHVEVSAPGVAIVSTVRSGYGSMSGTSMATPHVAAVAALIAERTGARGQILRQRLAAAVDDLGPLGRDPYYGFGRINLCKALGGACSDAQQPAATPSPTPLATPSATPVASPSPSPTPAPQATPAPSGPGTVAGATNVAGRPQSGVSVGYYGPVSGTVTSGSDGRYATRVPAGDYTLRATNRGRLCRAGSASGPYTITVTIRENQTTTVSWYCP